MFDHYSLVVIFYCYVFLLFHSHVVLISNCAVILIFKLPKCTFIVGYYLFLIVSFFTNIETAKPLIV